MVRDQAACLSGSDVYCTTPPEFWRDAALKLSDDRADAYFISCANIQSIDVIEELENEASEARRHQQPGRAVVCVAAAWNQRCRARDVVWRLISWSASTAGTG